MARAVRRQAPSGVRVQLSGVDPLNLTGVVTPGPRVPAMPGNVVTYVDGVPRGVDELEDVPGIGPATLDEIRESARVGP